MINHCRAALETTTLQVIGEKKKMFPAAYFFVMGYDPIGYHPLV